MGNVPNTNFFTGNRERLRSMFSGTAPIVLTANGLLQRNSDTTYLFRQDSTFWYLTGINDPDVILVMDKSKDYLIIPGRDEHRVAFDGNIEESVLSSISGIETIYTEKIGWKHLNSRIKRVKHIATLGPPASYISYHGMYTNPARARLVETLKETNPDLELLDLRPHIVRMRMVKQPFEINAIQEAIDVTIEAIQKAKKKGWQAFAHEYEIEASITSSFRAKGYGHAYQPIIASGKNACTLHYIENNSPIKSGTQLLLDVGAEVNNYAADITRTYHVGEPSKRYRQVYDAVLEVHQFATEAIKPGVSIRDYENNIQQFMGEKLRELGLIKSINDANVRHYYPHSTSHFLGLDVHDIADYERPLEPGVVLTVEPGIYIPEEGIGIRIEDDVHLTDDGVTILSDKLPRMLE